MSLGRVNVAQLVAEMALVRLSLDQRRSHSNPSRERLHLHLNFTLVSFHKVKILIYFSP